MKLISDRKQKKGFSSIIFNLGRDLLIIFSYIIGFSLYAFVYLVWTINWKNISVWWITIPILGFLLSIAHMFFIHKGYLFCKALIMFSIMIYTFVLPIIIAVVN